MVATLQTTKIAHNNGTDAMTIDTSGNVTVKGNLSIETRPYALVDWGGNAYVNHTTGDFDNAVVNDGNHYSTSTYRFTCPIDGLYLCLIHLLGASGTSAIGVDLEVNGSRVYRPYHGHRSLTGHYVHKATAGDYFQWVNFSSLNYYEGTGVERYSYASFTYLG
jgi:hypothetical protein